MNIIETKQCTNLNQSAAEWINHTNAAIKSQNDNDGHKMCSKFLLLSS